MHNTKSTSSPTASDPNDLLLDGETPSSGIYEQTPDERDAAERNYQRYFYVRGRGHLDYILMANRCDRFYRGEQWADADIKALEDAGRPAMTVNMVLTAVNSVLGEYSSKRVDFRFKPKRGGASVQQASILNRVIMHETDETEYDDHESDMFKDGIITDRGYLDIRMTTENNVAGELDVSIRDPRSVIPDPDASGYDPKTWRDVITTEFLSLEDIALRFGEEKAKLTRSNIGTIGNFAVDSVEFFQDTTFGDTIGLDIGAENGAYYGTADTAEQSTVRKVRVIDRQFWQVGTFLYFVNPEVSDSSPVPPGWDRERVDSYAERYSLEVVTKKEKRVRWVVSADKTLLHDDWSPYSTFTIIPFYPFFRRGHPLGMVRNLLSSQEILNKTTSQLLHIVNTTANSGWVVRSGSLMNMTADDLAAKGSQTGLVIEVAPGQDAPEKIQPNTVPTGVDHISQRALESIFEISGMNRGVQGQEAASIAGVSLTHKKQSALLQLQPVFDNLARTRRMVGRKLLELVQHFYTDQRVFMISDYTQPHAEPQEMAVNEMQEDETGQVTIANDLSLGKYGVSIGTMPAKDVFSEVQFTEALSLREAGVVIPDHRIISFSNLDQKEEIAEESKQMQGLAPPSEEELQQQQVMQQVQMQQLQIELEDKAADVELKRAQSQLAQAKAMEAADTPALEREKLELEGTITTIEQATRERVTRLKELASQVKQMAADRTKLEIERGRLMGSMAVATIASANKNERPTNANNPRGKK